MNRNQLISSFFIALLIYILYNVLAILSPFVHPIFWSVMISFGFYPFYEKVLKWFRGNKNLASAAVTLLILFAAIPLVFMSILLAIREVVHFYEWLANYIKTGGADQLLLRVRSVSWIRSLEEAKLIQWEVLRTQAEDLALNSAGTIGNFVIKHATILTKNVLSAVFNFFLTFFLVFFLLRDGDRVYRFIHGVTPLDEDNKNEIFFQLSETFAATLRGQLLTSVVQASVLGLVFWILKLPLPFLFAGVAFLASMIPVVGVSSVWVPFCIYLFLTQDIQRAVWLLILGVFVISLVDNFLKPLVIGQKTKLPYSLLFVGILGGLQFYGVMGIFLAPAVLSLFFVLIRIFQRKLAADIP